LLIGILDLVHVVIRFDIKNKTRKECNEVKKKRFVDSVGITLERILTGDVLLGKWI
jgi:hypothetical protein